MKKIFTLFLGMIVALTAVAAPVKREIKALPTKQNVSIEKTIDVESIVPAKAAEKAVVLRQGLEKAAVAAKAPKAKLDADTIDVPIYDALSKFYADDNDIFYALFTDETYNTRFTFDIYCAAGDQDVVSGQTYTIDGMWATYCALQEYDASQESFVNSDPFVEASFTKTVNEDGSYTIEALAKGQSGAVYRLSFGKAAPIEESIALNGTIQFVDYGVDCADIVAADEDTTILVSLLMPYMTSRKIVGSFNEADLYGDYTYIFKVVEEDTLVYFIQTADFKIVYDADAEHYTLAGTLNTYEASNPAQTVIFTINLTLEGEAPAEVVPSDMTFQFDVTEESVTIIPSNDEDPWDFAFISQAELDYYCGGDIDVLASMMFDNYGDDNAAPGEYTVAFSTIQSAGYTSGEVLIVVWGADGGVTTPAASVVILLPEIQPSDNVITVVFNETTQMMEFTTTNEEDTYFLWIESLADYSEYQSDFSQASVNAETDDWINTVAQAGYISYYLFSGDMELDISAAVDGEGDYVILVAPAVGSVRNGDAIYLQFHYGTQEGIEEVLSAGKAAKVVRDGQVLILKGDKVFNAFGAQLK
jgi:hypothetical protein